MEEELKEIILWQSKKIMELEKQLKCDELSALSKQEKDFLEKHHYERR